MSCQTFTPATSVRTTQARSRVYRYMGRYPLFRLVEEDARPVGEHDLRVPAATIEAL
jgi:hypothetical protein